LHTADQQQDTITRLHPGTNGDVRTEWPSEGSTKGRGLIRGKGRGRVKAASGLSISASGSERDGPLGGAAVRSDGTEETAHAAESYLESIANSPEEPKGCLGWFVSGMCEGGHRWAKEVYCGREWCEGCRDNVHGRRIARWLPKAFQLREMGELVVTFPPEDREGLRTKADLSEVGKLATTVVRRTWSRGLRRWHFFGEDHGHGNSYHPHLNFIVAGGPVRKAVLRRLRAELKRVLGLSREPVIHYQWTDKPGKMFHRVKYVARATFLERSWDPELAEELHGFRNVSWWGKWAEPPEWSLDDLVDQDDGSEVVPGELPALGALEDGTCPLDGAAIRWKKGLMRGGL